jgi:hypothetical protein
VIDERNRLEDADFVTVSCGDLTRVSCAIDAGYLHIVVNDARKYLNSFEVRRQDNNVAAGSVSLGDQRSQKKRTRCTLAHLWINVEKNSGNLQ